MRRKAIRRGALFYADLDPVIGSEQGGTRPKRPVPFGAQLY